VTNIDPEHLEHYGSFDAVKDALAQVERDLLAEALRQAGGDRAQAARQLGLQSKTLSTKLAEYHLG
jgi:DNA-binding NtrC family response regulator